MTLEGLDLTNVWLGILAIVSLLEFLALAAVAWFAFRLYRRTMSVIESIERNQIAPLRARVDGILDEVQVITARAKRAEESVSHALRQVTGTGSHLVDLARAKAWPIVGLVRGIRSAASAVFDGRSSAPPERHLPEQGALEASPH